MTHIVSFKVSFIYIRVFQYFITIEIFKIIESLSRYTLPNFLLKVTGAKTTMTFRNVCVENMF